MRAIKETTLREHYDVIVIGSGAGGAVVAKELAEGGLKVAIVEEGAHHHVASHTDIAHDAILRLYRDRGFTTTIGHPVIPIPLGRAVGGTTVINSGTCFRTPDHILARWRDKLGLNTLQPDRFHSIFEKMEREINVEESRFEDMSECNRIVHELLSKRGTPGRPLKRNVKNCEGCGFCCYGCPTGAKQSMDVSYIPKAIRAGAVLYTRCRVEKIIKNKQLAIGIEGRFLDEEYRPNGKRLILTAEYTILAAGSLISPDILKANGIASRNSNLGRNLTIHPATKVFAQFDREIRGWEGTPQAYYFDGLKDQGFVLEGIFVPPDIAAMTVPFVGHKLLEFMKNYRFMASFGFLINDSGTGRVTRLPLLGRSVIYSLHKEDVEKFRRGVCFLARLFLEGGARKVVTLIHGFSELTQLSDVERLEKAPLSAKDVEGMAFHPLGTCRMSNSPSHGIVDQDFKVHGWDGLYVCDGSVIPTALGVNPQVTIMAFATLCAQKILEKRNQA